MTVKAQFNSPQFMTMDSSGNIYVVDGGNCVVRQVTPTAIYTVAGTGTCSSEDGPDAKGSFDSGLSGIVYVGSGQWIALNSGAIRSICKFYLMS